MKSKGNHLNGLKILFGQNYQLWDYDNQQLSFVTPYFLSQQMAKLTNQFYLSEKPGHQLQIWDMFAGIGTDSVYLSQYFNVIASELSPTVYQYARNNLDNFGCSNVNLININCVSLLTRITPDLVYFDPPWGENYNSRRKSFDFGQVMINYPLANDSLPQIPKKISCLDLINYIYQNLSQNLIIKSPLNSDSYERLFGSKIIYIHKCHKKNLKFIYVKG